MKNVYLKPDQIDYLIENLEHLDALVDGSKTPSNAAGKRIILVASGQVSPKTKYEKAYLTAKKNNYSLNDLKRQREKNQSKRLEEAANSSIEHRESIENSRLAISQRASLANRKRREKAVNSTMKNSPIDRQMIPGAGTIKRQGFTPWKVDEPLGTRDDYKKDRASWTRR